MANISPPRVRQQSGEELLALARAASRGRTPGHKAAAAVFLTRARETFGAASGRVPISMQLNELGSREIGEALQVKRPVTKLEKPAWPFDAASSPAIDIFRKNDPGIEASKRRHPASMKQE